MKNKCNSRGETLGESSRGYQNGDNKITKNYIIILNKLIYN